MIRHGALPKWMGWVAVLLAVVTMTPAGFIGLLGTVLWIAVVSIMLAVREGSPAAA